MLFFLHVDHVWQGRRQEQLWRLGMWSWLGTTYAQCDYVQSNKSPNLAFYKFLDAPKYVFIFVLIAPYDILALYLTQQDKIAAKL